MKKFIKLIVLLVVLAGLVVGYVLYSNYKAEQEKENTDIPQDTTVNVLSIEETSVTSIEYSYDEEKIMLKKKGDKWLWAEDEDFPLEQSYPEYMLDDLTNIVADRLVAENLDNEADFGMDEPNFVINYSTSNGEEYVYTIGDYNSAAKCYYIKSSVSDKIYMTKKSAVEPFVYYILEMAEVDTIPKFEAEKITSVSTVKEGKKQVITTDRTGADFYNKPYDYFYVEDNEIKIPADGVATGEFLNAVEALSLGEVVEFKPSDSKISECGLSDTSRIVLRVTYDEEVSADESETSVTVTKSNTFNIYIGKDILDDGKDSYYAMFEGSNFLYELSGGKTLFEKMSVSFMSKLVCPVSADDTVSVKIELGSEVYFYNIDDIKNSEKLTKVFNSLTGIVHYGKIRKAPSDMKAELACKVTFDVGDEELVLEVYKREGSSNYNAVFDGMLYNNVNELSFGDFVKELQS